MMRVETKASLRHESDRLRAVNQSLVRDLKAAYVAVAELAQDRDSWRGQSMDASRTIDKLEHELDYLSELVGDQREALDDLAQEALYAERQHALPERPWHVL